jgi:anti-sigma28 factor (negative regulator of flagellin synthesis)
MSDSKVIIISDLLDTRARKEKELAFYQDELRKLEEKMKWLKMEIRLTSDIITMIEKEKIIDIKEMIKNGHD